MIKLLNFITLIGCAISAAAQYSTPGTGICWNLNQLASNSGGIITVSENGYVVSNDITISASDTVRVNTAATLIFATGKYLYINGTLITGPDTVKFTSSSHSNIFGGIRFENSPSSYIQNAIIEYSGGIKVISSDMTFEGCHIRNNGKSYASGAINPFQCNPVIRNCRFTGNQGAAIATGANAASSPQIINNYISGNNTSNANTPQINLGTSSTDTIRITGNTITGTFDNTGGIAVSTLAGGNAVCRIENNLIHHNRYGIAIIGNNISSVIAWNTITDNNIQNNPNLGGSGINFNGGTTNVSKVFRNTITGNLWGITIQQSARPNLGKIENGLVNIGRNIIMNNGNNNITYNLYNNTAENIDAENNFWGTNNVDSVEMTIFHHPDNESLGVVDYLPVYAPPTVITTPGTGINWNMQQLAAISDGTIQLSGKTALIHIDIIISESDTLSISDADTIRFSPASSLAVNGNFLAERDTTLVITSIEDSTGWEGIVYAGTAFHTQNVTISHSKGIEVLSTGFKAIKTSFLQNHPSAGKATVNCHTASASFENCIFNSNYGSSLKAVNSNISLFRTDFTDNICYDTITPLVKIDGGTPDTVLISECWFNSQNPFSGGIEITNHTDIKLNLVADSNEFKNGRYGLMIGGENIDLRLSRNLIINNTPQADIAETGSAIIAEGDSSIIINGSYNTITNNYRGIVLKGFVRCNLGETGINQGHNFIFNNTDGNTVSNLSNFTPNTVYAQHNYWGSANEEEIEETIFHYTDDTSLGMVIYKPFLTLSVAANDVVYTEAWPNPCHNQVNLNVPYGTLITLFSSQGKAVYLLKAETGFTNINCANLIPGIYILRLIGNNFEKVIKLVKI